MTSFMDDPLENDFDVVAYFWEIWTEFLIKAKSYWRQRGMPFKLFSGRDTKLEITKFEITMFKITKLKLQSSKLQSLKLQCSKLQSLK
jgi:hypothetical protein